MRRKSASASRETSGETRGHAVTRSERKQGDSGNTRGAWGAKASASRGTSEETAGANACVPQGTLACLRASLRMNADPQQAKLFEDQSFQNPLTHAHVCARTLARTNTHKHACLERLDTWDEDLKKLREIMEKARSP